MSQLLGGRYQFIKILGSDELEQTYLVGDTQFPGHPKRVAKHLQLPDRNPRTLKFVLILLKKKAEALQKVGKHDQIPQILDYFEENNNFYLVEEFILGHPLSDEILPKQALSELWVLQFLREVMEILVVVHRWGFIHRRIKPSNLLRRHSDSRLVLTGFGIFKEISAEVMRSPEYASPFGTNGASAYIPTEQTQGQLQSNSDIYAVGMIGIQAITGLTAPELIKLQNAGRFSQGEIWNGRTQISSELAAILDRMVHPDTSQRYQEAAEVLDDLNRLVSGEEAVPISPPRPQRSNLAALPVRRSWLPAGVALLVLGALAIALHSRFPQRLLSGYLLNQGLEQEEQGDDQQAIARYSQSIRTNPSSEAHFNRGVAHSRLGDQQSALDDLTQAIQLNPNQPEVYFFRGNVRYELGDRQGALADYTEAIRLDPQSARAYVNRGSVRADQGDDRGAVEDYTQAIQIDPNLAAAYLNRCLSRSNLEQHREAIDDCTQAIGLQPNSVEAYQNRGLVRRRLGDITGAIEDFNIAIRLDPDDADPYYNRGLARSEYGDETGAIADYSEAIERNPNHPFAYYDRALSRLDAGDQEGAIADFHQSAKLCLDSGRTGCYEDAQYQIEQLQEESE
ncbi:MAG: tetratricopeptide repeat protein [Leptolyngbyaceae cyanobacterium RM2_2_4]|nr:tetratricopeptide repeat protein [Leptolyngbyaceae cyanobacterium SM1_4_3]NJO50484.1 tetratricopeptide repeat protein [Leptolyngbyaceae cyanobacterium RM2_2_4]